MGYGGIRVVGRCAVAPPSSIAFYRHFSKNLLQKLHFQRKALRVVENLPENDQDHISQLYERVSLHIVCIHLKRPQGPLHYGRKLSDLWPTVMGILKGLYLQYTSAHIVYDILYISNTGQIQPVHPHYCAFLLLNAAKCSVLPQLFHEIKPYGFDINGKYEREAFCALQSGPASLSCSEICVTTVILSQSLLMPDSFSSWGSLTPAQPCWQSSQDVSSQQNLRCLSAAEARTEKGF